MGRLSREWIARSDWSSPLGDGKDGDLLGWAFAYEQTTKHRKPPELVEK
jgi:hypothetical protein